MITKETIQLTDTRLRGKFTVKFPNSEIREKRHDCSCCDKKHFFGGFFCPEMLDHYNSSAQTETGGFDQLSERLSAVT